MILLFVILLNVGVQKMNKEMKLCPFCGSNSIGVFSRTGFIVPYNHGLVVYCQDCESNGPIAETRKEAWEKWNKRSGEDDKHSS